MMPGFLFPMPIPTPDYPPEGGDAPADAAGSPDEATAPGKAFHIMCSRGLTYLLSTSLTTCLYISAHPHPATTFSNSCAPLTTHGRHVHTDVTIISGLIDHAIEPQSAGMAEERQAMHTKSINMCNAVVGGEQAPDQDGSGLGSDSQPPPGQDSLERDLGGDSWDQGSGNEGQQEQLLAPAKHLLCIVTLAAQTPSLPDAHNKMSTGSWLVRRKRLGWLW